MPDLVEGLARKARPAAKLRLRPAVGEDAELERVAPLVVLQAALVPPHRLHAVVDHLRLQRVAGLPHDGASAEGVRRLRESVDVAAVHEWQAPGGLDYHPQRPGRAGRPPLCSCHNHPPPPHMLRPRVRPPRLLHKSGVSKVWGGQRPSLRLRGLCCSRRRLGRRPGAARNLCRHTSWVESAERPRVSTQVCKWACAGR